MNFSFVGTAMAQAADAAAEQGQPSIGELLFMPAIFLLIMYFFIFRPQARKAKEHQKLLTSIKVGDEVVTSGGIIGRIRSVAEGFVTIEAGHNTSLKVLKSNVMQMTKTNDKTPAKA